MKIDFKALKLQEMRDSPGGKQQKNEGFLLVADMNLELILTSNSSGVFLPVIKAGFLSAFSVHKRAGDNRTVQNAGQTRWLCLG